MKYQDMALIACIAVMWPIHMTAQIIEIATITGRYETLNTLATAGPKLIERDAMNVGFELFEPDLTPFLTVTYPTLSPGYNYLSSPSYITEATFDQDPSTIEYVMQFYSPGYEDYGILVARADGTVLLVDSTFSLGGVNGPDMFSSRGTIMNTPNGTIMVLIQGLYGNSKIYSLPGQLPCLDCGSGDIGMGFGPEVIMPDFGLFPNPTDGIIMIDASAFAVHRDLVLLIHDAAGRQVRMIRSQGSGKLTFSTAGLAQGSYQAVLTDESHSFQRSRTFVVQ